MNLLNLDQANREAFVKTLNTLVNDHKLNPNEVFVNVLESNEAPEMNYWMAQVLLTEHQVNGQQVLAQDASGEDVKPLQAACLLQNVGVAAALLEAGAFEGSVVDRDFQLAARIASKHEDQAVLAVLMKFSQERGELEWMMKTLQGTTLQ